jgi:hypothetical protein
LIANYIKQHDLTLGNARCRVVGEDGDMRWDRLFDDLEAQLVAQERLELDAEVSERTRTERAKVALEERIVGAKGEQVAVHLAAGRRVEGAVADVGDGWFVLEDRGRPVLVPVHAVMGVVGLPHRPRSSSAARRLGLGYALRAISRDRRPVHVHDVYGGLVSGTIDAVGADVLDVSEHAPDEPRRGENVRARRAIPFSAVASVAAAG